VKSHNVSTQLIINADDFGLTSAINEEIIRCIKDGVVTSTSLIAGGRAADEAMKFAQSFNEDTGLGIHLTLDSETPVADPVSIPTIVSKKGVLLGRSQIIARLCTGQSKLEDVHREWSAQIEKVLNAGLKPDHIDSHGHIHCFPVLVSLVVDIAKHFGISAVRLPATPWGFRLSFKRVHSLISLHLAAKFACTRFKSVLRHPDYMMGFSFGGRYSEKFFLKDIDSLKNHNIVEAMFHPGPDRIDVQAYNSWNYNWAVDSATLRSNHVKDLISEKGVKLITFKELPESV
jgi:chitin disaccharide deacetylase